MPYPFARQRRLARRVHFERLEDRSLLANDLRFVTYNVHAIGDSFNRGDGLPSDDVGPILQAIGSEVRNGLAKQVDLVALQEVRSQATTSADVVAQLNAIYGAGVYARGTLNGNPTSDTVGLVYNTQTLDLLDEIAIGSASSTGQPRQTIRYRLRPDGGNAASEFYVYNSHYKSGTDSDAPSDADRREIEALAIRTDANTLGSANIIYAGDFNLQESAEDAYQVLIGAGNGQAFDPLNRPGNWHSNNSFKDIVTQAPLVTALSGFTGGGLDDRFDFQLISGELTDGAGLEYLANSYHTFGINGSLNVNTNVNDSGNTALPLSNFPNRTTLLNWLAYASDHLPVVADYQFASANSAPTNISLAPSTIAENAGASATVGTFTTTDPDSGNTFTYSLVTGTGSIDNAQFTISGSTLRAAASLNYEAGGTRSVRIRSTDQGGLFFDKQFTITVTNANEAPTIAPQTFTVPENSPSGTAVGTVLASDPDASDSQTFAILSGNTGSAFTLHPSTGALSVNSPAALDFETNPSFSLSVRVTDGGGLSATATVVVNLSDLVEVNTLRVQSVTSSHTAVALRFSHPLDFTQLNLVDSNNTYGAADLSLVGTATGPVSGSLVFDADGLGLKFIKSGGIFQPDTYTLTLRSAAQGFISSTGLLLDGNGDDTPGDNHVSQFVVTPLAPETVIMSVGDILRGYGQSINLPATSSNGIPISLSTGLNVAGASFTLAYDPTLLTIAAATSPIPGASISVNTGVPGQITVALASDLPFTSTAGPITIANLQATVPVNATYGGKSVLDLRNVNISAADTSDLPAIDDDGIQIAAYRGDANNNRSINTGDVTALLRALSGSFNTSGFSFFRVVDPALIGDMNDSASLTTGDATGLLRFLSGASGGFPAIPPLPTGLGSPPQGPDPEIFIARDLTAARGDLVDIPLQIKVTEPAGVSLAGVDVSLAFDPAQLEFVNANLGSTVEDFNFALTVVSQLPGQVRLLLTSAAGPALPLNYLGTLGHLQFRVRENAPAGVTPLNLLTAAATDNRTLDLTIAPMISPGEDVSDGLLEIVSPEPVVLPVGPLPLATAVAIRNARAGQSFREQYLSDVNHLRAEVLRKTSLSPEGQLTQEVSSALEIALDEIVGDAGIVELVNSRGSRANSRRAQLMGPRKEA